MKRKINLFGNTFTHNLVNGEISSTNNKISKNIKFVQDGTGEVNLFVDKAVFEFNFVNNNLPSYAWLLESRSIHPDLIKYFKNKRINAKDNFQKVFTHNLDLIESHYKFEFVHPIGYWVDDKEIKQKNKLVSMVASSKKNTPMQKKRNRFANKFSNKIDVYGTGRNFIEKKEDGLAEYYFSYVFENDLTNDYFSEKILDCFAMKTVPIYYGTKNIKKFFNTKGIIDYRKHKFEDLTVQNYLSRLEYIDENYKLVKNYKIPEDTIYQKIFNL